jgi:hypothetical protein
MLANSIVLGLSTMIVSPTLFAQITGTTQDNSVEKLNPETKRLAGNMKALQGLNMSRIDTTIIDQFKVSGVSLEKSLYRGETVFKVTMPSSSFQNPSTDTLTDRAILAWLPIDFRDGEIELDVASTLAPGAPDFARGFIGVGFRIDPQLNFEGLYLRPSNSRADDQVRRNHSVQYFSYPDFDFARLRRESPEKYESYADMSLNEWIHMKIEVSKDTARLYINGAPQPSLIVNDLKHGSAQHGGVGFWIESGTIGRFKNLKITPKSD